MGGFLYRRGGRTLCTCDRSNEAELEPKRELAQESDERTIRDKWWAESIALYFKNSESRRSFSIDIDLLKISHPRLHTALIKPEPATYYSAKVFESWDSGSSHRREILFRSEFHQTRITTYLALVSLLTNYARTARSNNRRRRTVFGSCPVEKEHKTKRQYSDYNNIEDQYSSYIQ